MILQFKFMESVGAVVKICSFLIFQTKCGNRNESGISAVDVVGKSILRFHATKNHFHE